MQIVAPIGGLEKTQNIAIKSMIKPILSELPSIPISSKDKLPVLSGIYFVMDNDNVLYIGKAINVWQRWKGHHRHNQIVTLYPNARIAWMEIEDLSLLNQAENALIENFNPLLNRTEILSIANPNKDKLIGRGSNSNSHGNNPKIGERKLITLPDRSWDIAKSFGGYSEGVRKMVEVASGQAGILWAVPTHPLDFSRSFDRIPHEHITLWYGCDRSQAEEYIGVIFSAAIVEICESDRIQAAKVILPTGIPFKQSIPHITLSMADGVAPVESAAMLQQIEGNEIEQVAAFRIEFFEFS